MGKFPGVWDIMIYTNITIQLVKLWGGNPVVPYPCNNRELFSAKF